MTDLNTSASLEDLLNEEEEQLIAEPTTIKTGIGENIFVDRAPDETEKPNALRWLFNPFEVIDLTNEPTSCGVPFLRNVVFNPIKSLDVKIAKTDAYELPGTPHNGDNYNRFKRTSLMIATELCDKNGDKGVVNIALLLDQDEQTAADLNTLLFDDEVVCTADIENPDHPCPILPNLLETLQLNVKRNSQGMDAETRGIFIGVAKQCQDSIALAMRNARMRIDEAQKRILDKTNPNRNFSAAEKRCYLALGLEIPNVMPYTTASAAAAAGMGQGGQLDGEAVGRGFAQGLREAGMQIVPAGKEPVSEEEEAFPPLPPVEDPGNAAFNVDETDVENADKTADQKGQTDVQMCSGLNSKQQPCGNKAGENGFCKAHSAS